MPIPVACRCGKSFAANDNLAGKTVKCPSCQQPLTIPAAGGQAASSPGSRPTPSAAPAATADGKIVVACRCGAKFAAGAELAGRQVKCPKCGQPLTVGGAAAPAPPQAAVAAPAPNGGGMIPVACRCGAKFAAKAELRGKTVKCPKCSQPLTVGAGAPAAITAPAANVAAAAPALGGGDFGLGDLLDEVGVKARASGDSACPSCGAFMAPESVLCIECGYDRKTGRKINVETVKKVEAKKLGPPSAAAKAGAAKANPYASPGAAGSAVKPYNPDAQLTTMDYLFVIFCGWIALLVAIIYLIQGNPKGKPMIIAWFVVQAIAFGIGIVLGVIAAVMGVSAQ